MSEWKEYKLGETCEITTGFAFKGDEYEPSGNLKVVRGENVTIGKLRWDSEKHWNKSTEYLEKYFLNEGDIVIGMDGSRVGQNRAIIRKEELPLILAQRVARLRARNGFNQKFLWYHIFSNYFREYVEAIHTGTSIPHISQSQISDLEISAPNEIEQTAIAEILSSLDDKIDLLHRQNKTLEELAETLFRQWFIVEAEESWEEKSLDEIAEYLNGLALQKFPGDSLPVIKIREMKQGISDNTDRCSNDIPEKYIIHEGDILFSWSGSLEVVIWSGGNGALNQHLFKVSSKEYPKWFYYLATKFHLENFKTIAESKSTTMGHIQREHLSEAKISVPPKSIFEEHHKVVAPLIDKQIRNNSQIRTLTQLRDTLLPKLMSGEICLNQDLQDEQMNRIQKEEKHSANSEIR